MDAKEDASTGGNMSASEQKATQSPQRSPRAGNETPIEADSPSTPLSASNEYDNKSLEAESAVFAFESENGRTYHAYRAGQYHFPNDSNEVERLNFQFDMLKYAFSGRNYFAPISNPKHILDIGTGTGQWAIEMGDEFPEAEIQATDLSPIQPLSVPENVHFYIDDASEEDWAVPPAHFDYIHTRILLGCFTNFQDIIRKGFHYTKPGGFMESVEILTVVVCDDNTMPADWPFLEWAKFADEAAIEVGRPVRIADKMRKWYEGEGFVDVREEVMKLPMNAWPRDPHLKELGRLMEQNWLAGLNAFSMAYFSRVMQWTKTEIEVYLVNIRKCIIDKNVHAYHKIYVVWGRKPLSSEVPPSSHTTSTIPVRPSTAPS